MMPRTMLFLAGLAMATAQEKLDGERDRFVVNGFRIALQDGTKSSTCTSLVAEAVRMGLEDCLRNNMDTLCAMDPLYVGLGDTGCSGSNVRINSAVVDFTGSSSVPSLAAVNGCVMTAVEAPQCLTELQRYMPNLQAVEYTSLILTVPQSTPAPTTPAPVTDAPTVSATMAPTMSPTSSPSGAPIASPTPAPSEVVLEATPAPSEELVVDSTPAPSELVVIMPQSPTAAPTPVKGESSGVVDENKSASGNNSNLGLIIGASFGGGLLVFFLIGLEYRRRNAGREWQTNTAKDVERGSIEPDFGPEISSEAGSSMVLSHLQANSSYAGSSQYSKALVSHSASTVKARPTPPNLAHEKQPHEDPSINNSLDNTTLQTPPDDLETLEGGSLTHLATVHVEDDDDDEASVTTVAPPPLDPSIELDSDHASQFNQLPPTPVRSATSAAAATPPPTKSSSHHGPTTSTPLAKPSPPPSTRGVPSRRGIVPIGLPVLDSPLSAPETEPESSPDSSTEKRLQPPPSLLPRRLNPIQSVWQSLYTCTAPETATPPVVSDDEDGAAGRSFDLDPSWNPDDNSVDEDDTSSDGFSKSLLSGRSESWQMEPLKVPPELPPPGSQKGSRTPRASTPRIFLS